MGLERSNPRQILQLPCIEYALILPAFLSPTTTKKGYSGITYEMENVSKVSTFQGGFCDIWQETFGHHQTYINDRNGEN